MCDWLQSASELRMLSATPKLQLVGTLVICRLSASTATSLGCFIAFIEPVVGIPLCNLDNMYHGGIFEFFRLNYIQKRHRGVVIQQCEITCSYAATWSSPHLCVTRPCCPHRGFHSCENIWDNKSHIKESDPEVSASESKIWVWNIYIDGTSIKCSNFRLHVRRNSARSKIVLFHTEKGSVYRG